MPQPKLDEDLVQRLAKIAARLDGGDELADASLLDEFNQLADTDIPFSEFQGIYGAEEHIDYVRRVLTDRATEASPNLDREALKGIFAKVLADPCDDAYLQYIFTTIEKTFGDTQISDLVFWPGEYFGDGDNQRELTPELMADAVLERYAKRQSR
jgi:hypothetical protein